MVTRGIYVLVLCFKGRGFFLFWRRGEEMVKINNVSKTFKQKTSSFNALKNVTLDINKGEIFGIIGYSGAGKSTLLRVIAGLETVDTGEVYIDGVDFQKLSRRKLREFRRKIGVVFQGYNLLMQRNVFKNIAFPLELAKVNNEFINNRVEGLLELTQIQDKKYAYPSQLSGGQKQRVAIARALATKPKILLLDEFTSALDKKTTTEILDLIKDINQKEQVTIIVISHDIELIRSVATRVAVIDKGEVLEVGKTIDVLNNSQNEVTKRLLGETR